MKTAQKNSHLLKQALLSSQANSRRGSAHTRTRGEIKGGGRKPWKQKGTGRARAGSSRSPLWTGGGITFGPRKERNFKRALPKKMARQALKQALELARESNQIVNIPSLVLKEPKTKLALALFEKLNIKGKILLITEDLQPELILATNNLPGITAIRKNDLSLLDLAAHQTIVIEQKSFDSFFPTAKKPKNTVKAKIKTEKA